MRHVIILLVIVCVYGNAQVTMSHFGDLKMHNGASLGLHGNFQNLAPFNQSEGLIGFYGLGDIRISGNDEMLLYDLEISTDYQIQIDLNLSIKNNLNFISGDIETELKKSSASVTFLPGSFYNGASDFAKVKGYVSASNAAEFIFPIGDSHQLRPLQLAAAKSEFAMRCAYFRENPVTNTNLGILDSLAKPREIKTIGTYEYWQLEGDSEVSITLGWNPESNLLAIADNLDQIEIIGWQRLAQSWQLVGTLKKEGDLQTGFAVSDLFNPNDYEVLTFGSRRIPKKFYTLENNYLSPNNDGVNDFLEIEELLDAPKNILKIYDRRGLLVFSASGYTNEFIGISNTSNRVIERNAGLPQGVYFFVAQLLEEGKTYQGFLYLDR